MSEITYFSKEGLEKLKEELHILKSKQRPELSKQIAEAREKGDLSENAEYDAAKEAQGLLELRISKLEEILGRARVMDESAIDTSKVHVLSTVHVKNYNTNKKQKYTLVSEKEADLKAGKISVKSPIGSGLLGKAVGEIAEINVPAGVLKLEIIEITVE